MEYAEHVDATAREAAALAEALRDGPLDEPVPTCPEWTVANLAYHVGHFTGFWTHVLCDGTGRPKTPADDPAPGDDIVDWYETLTGYLLAELRATPPETEVWTWVESDRTARFTARRCANELAVHRFDAQCARANPQPIEGALAADGIEEIFVMQAVRGSSGESSGQTLHLHGIDRGDEWLITLLPDRLDVRREHAKGDLALRGTVSDLELLLYQRPPVGDVERFGDGSVLDAWYRDFRFG